MSSSHFDQVAARYDETLPDHVVQHYLEKRLRFLQRHCRTGCALDVGCGTGALAALMAEAGYEMTGIDPSPGMLAVLDRRAPTVSSVVGSGTDLPFADDLFDLVYCVAVMHHIADPAAVRSTLAEMVRVARPGGRIVIWDHNPRNPYWRLLMWRVPQDSGDERLIPLDELLHGLTASDAAPVLVEQLGFVPDFTPRRMLHQAARLEGRIERTPMIRRICAHNVVLAVKSRSSGPVRQIDPTDRHSVRGSSSTTTNP